MNRNLSLPIGQTIMGFGTSLPYPVLFDPHTVINNNKGPATLITGSPGSGKTFFGLLLAVQASICNKIGFIIDPKGDFPILKEAERLGLCGKINLWSLFNVENNTVDKKNWGILDPTILYDDIDKNIATTINVIRMIHGDLNEDQSLMLTPIVSDVVKNKKKASFAQVVNVLQRSQSKTLQNLGGSLRLSLNLPISKLLIKPPKAKRNRLDLRAGGVTVASLLGIAIPSDGKDIKEYTIEERISMAIMALVSLLVGELMSTIDYSKQKLLIVDEARMIINTSVGNSMITDVALLGRSMNMATILLTQSPRHLNPTGGESKINSTITTRFAFRNDDMEDNKVTVESMKLPASSNWESLIASLDTGQCLMKDSHGQVGVVNIIARDDLTRAFSTNPSERI